MGAKYEVFEYWCRPLLEQLEAFSHHETLEEAEAEVSRRCEEARQAGWADVVRKERPYYRGVAAEWRMKGLPYRVVLFDHEERRKRRLEAGEPR